MDAIKTILKVVLIVWLVFLVTWWILSIIARIILAIVNHYQNKAEEEARTSNPGYQRAYAQVRVIRDPVAEAFRFFGVSDFTSAKAEYRKMARDNHPDKFITAAEKVVAEQKMRVINGHYAVLKAQFTPVGV